MDRDKRLGTILIGVGILALLGRAGLLEGAGTLFVLSAVALAIYAFSGGHRKYSNIASLIPGLVLVAIGISIYLEQDSTFPMGRFFSGCRQLFRHLLDPYPHRR